MTELDPEARAILEAGRDADNPTPDERARVRSTLLSTIATQGAASVLSAHLAAEQGGTAAAKTLGALLKLVVVGVAIGLGSGLLFYFYPRQPAEPASTRLERPSQVHRSVVTRATPSAVLAPVAPAPLPEPSRRAERAAQIEAAHSAPATRPVEDAGPATPSGSTARFAKLPADSVAPALSAGDRLAAETRDLRAAYGVIERGDPAHALTLLEQQSAAYPHGQLGPERAAARILALCKLGRTAEARAAAARFLATHPHSPLAGRVRGACPAH